MITITVENLYSDPLEYIYIPVLRTLGYVPNSSLCIKNFTL